MTVEQYSELHWPLVRLSIKYGDLTITAAMLTTDINLINVYDAYQTIQSRILHGGIDLWSVQLPTVL